MTNIFVISDTHFGHAGSCRWEKDDGSKVRSFDDVKEMDELLVKNWNSVVTPQDKIYHLGDVVMNKREIKTLARLNGKKRLVRGNHDIFKTKVYLEYFQEIYGCRVFKAFGDGRNGNMILTHIPIAMDADARWIMNVHGHLHSNVMPDNRYMNVCVEQTNYTPISLEEIRDTVKARFG